MPMSETAPIDVPQYLHQGKIKITGRFVYGSNFTFLAQVSWQGESFDAVYKPTQGERPLWDFPEGTLAAREVAAFITNRMLGWQDVPPTVLRDDGPSGGGSLQQFVDLEGARHYFELEPGEKQQLRRVALFDLVVNNADRKGGHVLLTPEGRIWLIDHGVCFHHQPKLRTVIWDFADEPIPEPLLEVLQRLLDEWGSEQTRLQHLLSERELDAMRARVQRLIAAGHFPQPPQGRRAHPWPLV